MVAEWGPLFTRRVIQPGFFCSFLLQCKVPPTFLYVTAVSDSHSHQLLGYLHTNTSVPALYAQFLELWQSAQSVPSSRVRVKGGKWDRTRKGWGEVIRSDDLDWGLYNKNVSVWESSWTKQRGYIENKGFFVQAEQGM